MSETINNNSNGLKKPKIEEKVWFKSLRLTLNLFTNILIILTVLVCCLFAFDTGVSLYTLHIILCVLGYQFFMCQGTMVISKYNSWSIYISRRNKKNIHIIFMLVGVLLATIGTCFIISLKNTHFTSTHGMLGLLALICSLVSILSGSLAMFPTKLSCCMTVYWIKFVHYVTGIASIFLASASLCAGFKSQSFATWVAHDNGTSLIISLAWLFTILVSLERLIIITDNIRNQVCC